MLQSQRSRRILQAHTQEIQIRYPTKKTVIVAAPILIIVLMASAHGTATPSPARKVTLDLSASNVDCGRLNDTDVHLPPNWKTFVAPEVGHGYVDPVFGCTVKRLTDSSDEDMLWDGTHASLGIYYSTFTPMNSADSLLMISSNDGGWRIKGTAGNLVVAPDKMPKMNDGHPVWDASDANVFYYTYENGLYKGEVRAHKISGSLLERFKEYRGVTSPDSADLSQDGDHIALAGLNPDDTLDVFVWSLGRRQKTSIYRTNCTVNKWGITQTPQPGCLHKILLTADNLLAIDFASDGTGREEGVRLWDGNRLLHLQDRTNHIDTGYDVAGVPIFIDLGRDSTLHGEKNPCPSGWGLDVRQIHNAQSATCLLDNQPSWHVSYRGSASQPWVALSFFDDRESGPEFFNRDARFRPPTLANWRLYEDEIVLTSINGEKVYRLAHARSRSSENYFAQPHAAISRDGKYVIFNSDMAYPNSCPPRMHVATECTDVYMIRVR